MKAQALRVKRSILRAGSTKDMPKTDNPKVDLDEKGWKRCFSDQQFAWWELRGMPHIGKKKPMLWTL